MTVERLFGSLGRAQLGYAAVDDAGDAGARDRRPQSLADDGVFGMILSEPREVIVRDPARPRVHKGDRRQLNEGQVRNEVVEHARLVRVDPSPAVARGDGLDADRVRDLVILYNASSHDQAGK